MDDFLKCYISGRPIQGQQKSGVISFAVPELGILFRCAATGGRPELESLAFLSFLRFAEHNRELFAKRKLCILSDFPVLVYLVNTGTALDTGSRAVLEESKRFAKSISFQMKWVESRLNRACDSAAEIPEMPSGATLKIKPLTQSVTPVRRPHNPDL